MLGFAISDDARRVWIGGPDDGLSRSDDGGMTFTPVASTHVACLRWHAGSLYVCADWLRESFALERWDDGASTPVPLLQFNQIQGPFACAPGTVENDTCGMRWPMQLTALQPRADAGHDAATDAAIDAPADSNVSDVVDVGSTGAEPSPHATCGCRSVGAGRSGLGPIVAWLLAMACARRRSQRATAGSAG
jgi:hypothetical protein